jgi:LysM repeat protein
MCKKAILVFLTLFSFALNAQNYRKHKVVQGETITQIAQKYNCTTSEIFSLNPDAQNGIQPDAVIIIPNAKTALATADNSH